MGQTASGGLVKCCQTPMAGSANVQQGADSLQPIHYGKPNQSVKPTRKKVSEAPAAPLTPSKRKLILLREEGEENFANRKKAAIDAEEAQEILVRAVTRGDTKAVQKAIASGASATTPNSRGLSPLMQCAGSLGATAAEALQVLVEHGASVSALDNNGWTALHHACRSGKVASAKYLLSVGADPMSTTGDGHNKTALMLATEDGKYDIVLDLVKDKRTKDHINAQDAYGFTALHHAMKVGCKDIVQVLIDRGAKAKIKDNEGRQALMAACQSGKLECVKLFFGKDSKVKADVNATDEQKQTALMLACQNQYEDLALWLVRKCKADVFMTDIHGDSAITIARRMGLHKLLACMVKPKEGADGGEKDVKAK